MAPPLSTAQTDRAAGVLLAQACGAALSTPDGPATAGEYEDAIQPALCLARVAATGADLTDERALGDVADQLSVRRTGAAAGIGALVRTTGVALAHLGEPEVMAEAACAVAGLTRAGPLAGEACTLWCAGVATAVTHGSFDGVRGGLDLLPARSRDRWARWLDEAERPAAGRLRSGEPVVAALQTAYGAIRGTPLPPDEPAEGSFACLHLQHALAAAVRAGEGSTEMAAVAGALLGARWGASAVPFGWRRLVPGLPGLPARDLAGLAVLAARRGEPDPQGWPQCARMPYEVAPRPAVSHPCDEGVRLGNVAAVSDADAVVSLCRRGRHEVPAPGIDPGDHIEVRLQDRTDPAENPNLEFVIDDAARAVLALRDEGRRVLLHCVHGKSRTPTVAARYAVLRGVPVADALATVVSVLPGARANPTLRGALDRLGEPPGSTG